LVSSADLLNPMLTARDVMTANPRTCSPASTVVEAVLVMREADCGMIPITEAGRPLGVVTDRDVALALPDHESDLARMPVGDLMTKDLVTIEEDAPIADAMDKLSEEAVRRVIVVDADGLLVGVLSWTDLVPQLSERAVGHVVSRLVEHRR